MTHSRINAEFDVPILIPRVPTADDVHKYILEIDSTQIYSNFGPLETRLRQRFSEIWGESVHLIQTACNATLALQGAIETAEDNGGVWEVPAWTFPATPLALFHAKKRFNFVDIDERTWRPCFTDEAENVVDVLPFGDELDLTRLERSNIRNLVIDGAASGVSLLSRMPKSSMNFSLIVSLHSTKLIPAAEGSLFFSNSLAWAERFKKWTNFGFNKERISELPGINAKFSEYGAALAHASLDDLDKTIPELSKIQTRAKEISERINRDCHPAMQKGLLTPYWIIILESEEEKGRVVDRLYKSKIQSRDWWGLGCHTLPIFHFTSGLPITDKIARQTIGLPMHTFLSSADLDLIENVLEEAINRTY